MPKIVTREYDKTKAGAAAYSNFTVVIPGVMGNGEGGVFDDNNIYECSSAADFKKYIGCALTGAIAPTYQYLDKLSEDDFNKYQPNVYLAAEFNKTGVVGYLKDATYIYKKANIYKAESLYAVIWPGNEGSDTNSYGNQMAYELLERGYTVLYKLVDNVTVYGDKTGFDALATDAYWEALKNKTMYDFRYITTGGYYNKDAYAKIAALANFKNADYILNPANDLSATGRGDCCALIDLIETEEMKSPIAATQISKVKAALNELDFDYSGKYTAIFAPKVIYDRVGYEEYNKNNTMPATFHYLACAAAARENYAEWYAVAGYTRGKCDLVVGGTTISFGDLAVNALAPRTTKPATDADGNDTKDLKWAINLITKDHNVYYIWGNRTAAPLEVYKEDGSAGLKASHFLNIRQLCTTIKKEIRNVCRQLTFDPNSDLLWVKFCNKLQPMLDNMRADQGISNYKFVQEISKAKALMTAKIRVVPIEAVEDFDLSITLEDSISGVVATIEEE